MKLVTPLKSKNKIYSRIEKLTSLGLSAAWEKQISNVVYENRMMWELWVETAKDWETLKKALRKRGYRNVPNHSGPMITGIKASNEIKGKQEPLKKIMVQKTKD